LILRQDLFKIEQSPVNTMFTGLFSFYKTSKSVLKTILLVTFWVTFLKPFLGHLFVNNCLQIN
ncbi:hypothetical protein, partial [Mesoflavibacter zeaxanthinifaciens]|uniref:hypothetical protein n=1 Tax=Mesoflavibacter zeaxanthinifaciens TaxID=393060 RepID=UPI003A90EFC9